MVISQFTDAFTLKGNYPMEKLQICGAVIQEIMSSWTGLYFFCVGEKQAIYAIIEALSLPNQEIRSILGNIKEINQYEWAVQFQGICLMVFVDAGLIEVSGTGLQQALVDIVLKGDLASIELALNLLSEILVICAKVLPDSYNDRVQALPILFASASDFQNESTRQFSREKLCSIFKIHLESLASLPGRARKTLPHPIVGEWYRDPVYAREPESLGLDDLQFKKFLADSEVLGVKDYTKWDWDAISMLMKGSLLNPKRFDELVRNTKFAQRMIHFLRPASKQFSEIPIDDTTAKMVTACSDFLCSLASSTPGFRFLTESRLLNDIAEKLAKLGDPTNFEIDISFSKEKMESLAAREYFTLLGELQRLQDGERIFEEYNLWTVYYSLIELRGRDDIVKRIIMMGNYASDGHMRIMFSKLLSAGYKEMRLFTTTYIKALLESGVPGLEEWIPQVLVPQLFDPAPAVSETALSLIRDCCRYPSILEALIMTMPDVEHLANLDSGILISFLQFSRGFEYLHKAGFVEREFKYWTEAGGALQYVGLADQFMTMEQVFNSKHGAGAPTYQFPPHFIGSLAKTPEGCHYLEDTEELQNFLAIIKQSTLFDAEEGLEKLKAALWTLAHIGSSDLGFALLHRISDCKFLSEILKIAETSKFLSIRGICIYSICLFAKSNEGRELLDDLGWTVRGGICVPKTTDGIFELDTWDYHGSWPVKKQYTFTPIPYRLEEEEDEILKCIGNLSNHIVASANSKRLGQLKQTFPGLFLSPHLYIMAMRLTCDYQFKVQSRRFIYDLFDKFSWDDASITILNRAHGVCFTTPIKYDQDLRASSTSGPKSSTEDIALGSGPAAPPLGPSLTKS
ncbi:hypothetical protein HDU91_006928, partial [Kappamyces sp. JEL0680]